MTLDITKEEQELLLAAIEAAVKNSRDWVQAANIFLPLATKLRGCKDAEPTPEVAGA